MKSLKGITGMPVVRTDNGRRAGRVARACVDDELTALCGVWVANGWRRARYCPAERIRLLGDVSILIDGELLRVRQSAACGHPLALRRALNAAGEMVGAITGAYVDEETLAIVAVELTRGFWEDLRSGRQLVRHFEVHVPEADVLVMEEGDESDEAWMDQGNDRGRGSGRVGGDGVRHDELAGGTQAGTGGDERRTDDV